MIRNGNLVEKDMGAGLCEAGGGAYSVCAWPCIRMTIDPRIPTMPGRRTSGFHHPGTQCLQKARSAVRGSASRMEGELHPSKNRS